MNESWLLTHDALVFRWGLSLCFICAVIVALLRTARFNPNLFHIPKNIIRCFIYLKKGRRYVANINGTWRIVKGSISESGYLHTNTLFPEGKVACLSENEFRKIKISDTDDEIRDKIINLNLYQLISLHPMPSRWRPQHFVMTDQPNYVQEALNHLSPSMRRYMERQLYPNNYIDENE